MCVTDRHDMTLPVKMGLNLHTINQSSENARMGLPIAKIAIGY